MGRSRKGVGHQFLSRPCKGVKGRKGWVTNFRATTFPIAPAHPLVLKNLEEIKGGGGLRKIPSMVRLYTSTRIAREI